MPYAIRHLEESVGSVCTDRILPAVLSIVPQLPPPDQLLPHFWPLSQVISNNGVLFIHPEYYSSGVARKFSGEELFLKKWSYANVT